MEGDAHLLLGPLVDGSQHDGNDLLHIILIEGMEHHDLIDSVDKLRLKDPFDLLHDPVFHKAVILFLVIHGRETQPLRGNDILRPRVGGHDQYGIFKIDLPSLGIGHMAVVQDLQKDVEYVWVSLLDLVKQNYRIGVSADFLA